MNYELRVVAVTFDSKILHKSVHLFISQHLWYFFTMHIYQRSLICSKEVCPRHVFLIYWNIHDQLDEEMVGVSLFKLLHLRYSVVFHSILKSCNVQKLHVWEIRKSELGRISSLSNISQFFFMSLCALSWWGYVVWTLNELSLLLMLVFSCKSNFCKISFAIY